MPAHLRIYVEALGADGAETFLLTFGGADLYLPERPTPHGDLVAAIGMKQAQALCAVRDRVPARIPTGKPWLARHLKAKGLSNAAIARRLHVTLVTVATYLKDGDGRKSTPKHRAQPDLFE